MWATGMGRPMWRSPQARIFGPSASRKSRLSVVIARKKTSDESSLDAASARPFSRTLTESLAVELACCFASLAVLGSTPRSCSQPWIVFLASPRCAFRSPVSLVMPATTT